MGGWGYGIGDGEDGDVGMEGGDMGLEMGMRMRA